MDENSHLRDIVRELKQQGREEFLEEIISKKLKDHVPEEQIIKECTLPNRTSAEMLAELVRKVKAKNHAAILKAMRSSKMSVEVEGVRITPEQEDLVQKRLSEQITEEEFHYEVMRLLKIES